MRATFLLLMIRPSVAFGGDANQELDRISESRDHGGHPAQAQDEVDFPLFEARRAADVREFPALVLQRVHLIVQRVGGMQRRRRGGASDQRIEFGLLPVAFLEELGKHANPGIERCDLVARNVANLGEQALEFQANGFGRGGTAEEADDHEEQRAGPKRDPEASLHHSRDYIPWHGLCNALPVTGLVKIVVSTVVIIGTACALALVLVPRTAQDDLRLRQVAAQRLVDQVKHATWDYFHSRGEFPRSEGVGSAELVRALREPGRSGRPFMVFVPDMLTEEGDIRSPVAPEVDIIHYRGLGSRRSFSLWFRLPDGTLDGVNSQDTVVPTR